MSLFHAPDGVVPLVFSGGKWTRDDEGTVPCNLGGTVHIKLTAEYPLPDPLQDPIPVLTGHGSECDDRKRLHRRRFRRQVRAHRRLACSRVKDPFSVRCLRVTSMNITHTPKRVVAAALLSGGVALAGSGWPQVTAQAQPGDNFSEPHQWCPGQPLPEADVHWDTNICHTWFWVPVGGMGNVGEFVWDGRLHRLMVRRRATEPRSACPACRRPARLLGQLVAGAVFADRNTVAAGEILGVQTGRIGDAATVDAKLGAVDVVQGVGALVVVRVERLVRGPAPQLGLLRGLLVLGAGEQPARRDAGQA